MDQYRKIFEKLNGIIDITLQYELHEHEKNTCQAEIRRIRGCLNQDPSFHQGNFLLKDVEKCLKRLLWRIEQKITSLEVASHGVIYYSNYIENRINDMRENIILRNTLLKMLNLISEFNFQVKRNEIEMVIGPI